MAHLLMAALMTPVAEDLDQAEDMNQYDGNKPFR